MNVVEYRQSESLLHKVLDLGKILHSYAIVQRYHKAISSGIGMYNHIGRLSVGTMYASTGYKVLNFRYGINESLEQLGDLRWQIRRSRLRSKFKSRLMAECETAESSIREELARRVV